MVAENGAQRVCATSGGVVARSMRHKLNSFATLASPRQVQPISAAKLVVPGYSIR